jgi:hypothetical protein
VPIIDSEGSTVWFNEAEFSEFRVFKFGQIGNGKISGYVLGVSAKLRKATMTFVMSVRPHGTLPVDGFS